MSAVGSAGNFAARLRAALPERWFADDAPVLASLLAGWAAAWAGAWEQLQAARRETRLATATGVVLDAAAMDLFGQRVRRVPGEADAALRARIFAAMRRPRVTRAALLSVAGTGAVLFEPQHPGDTGAWGVAGYGVAGRWGNLDMPGAVLLDVPELQVRYGVVDALPAGVAAWVRVR